MTQTVRKNSKQFAAAIENAKNVRVFSLDNGFSGKTVESFPQWIDKGDLKLVATDKGYTARVHSNLWFEFEAA